MSAETRALLLQLLADDKAVQFLPNEAGDFTIPAGTGQPAAIAAGVRDIDGDGLADLIIGAPGDDDKEADAGRVFIQPGSVAGGSSLRLGRAADIMTIEGAHTGDHVGSSVAAIRDLDGGGEDDILVGAPGTDIGSAVDAGAAYVIWSVAGSSVDLGDPFKGEGGGFAIKGEATGDAAGSSVLTIGDLNGDGKDDILVAAPGQDAGGSNAGAVYLVWGKAGDTVVNLANVASGSGGFRIVGSSAGDRAGSAIGTVADLNGDGKAEILIGAPGSILGGTGSGAVYVAWGKSGTGGIDLSAVEAGTGGFVIEGVGGDNVGSAIAGLGDVNGDGLSDILVGATGSDGGYVVFGKAGGSVVDLADVRNGNGGFRILAESPGGLAGLSVAGGQDFNHDGIVDIVVGAPHDGEGGADAGAIYVVWGGIESTIDLALVAQGIGGVKIAGYAGGLAGTSVTIAPDLNGDGTADLLVSAPGGSGSVWAVYSDPAWQPAAAAFYVHGTDGIRDDRPRLWQEPYRGRWLRRDPGPCRQRQHQCGWRRRYH